MHFMIYFQLNDLEIEKHYYWTQKRMKLVMVSSFDPHNICAKVERITAKTECTTCTNWINSFKVRWFHTKTHLLQKKFHFSKLISTQDFFCIQHATFKAKYWNFNPFWLHLIFFMHLTIYFQLNDLEIGKGYNLNSEKVETCHGIIIWPT